MEDWGRDSAVPYASVLRRVILLVFIAVAGELIWLPPASP